MYRFLIILALLPGVCITSAQSNSKINPQGLYQIRKYENLSASSRSAVNPRAEVFITLNKGYSLSDLDEYDIEELSVISNTLSIVSIPIDEAVAIADNKAVKRISFPKKAHPMLDKARAYCNVDQVQAGTGLNRAYDGTGVLAGIYDTGIDPNSPVFKTFPDGTSRVKAFFNGVSNMEYSADKITSATTDNVDETHGTHCASIMAGAATMPRVTISTSGVASVNETTNAVTIKPMSSGYPYGGVAPGADLYLAGGTLTTTQTIQACQKIIEYAKEHQQPAVINLSLGVSTGPRDGSAEINKAIEEMSKDAVFCVSAGNDGANKISIEKTFTATDKELKSFVVSKTASSLAKVDTDIEFWANNSEQLGVTFSLYDTNTKSIVYSLPLGTKEWFLLCSSDIYDKKYENEVTDATFSKYFSESEVYLATEISNDNNRCMIYGYFDLSPKTSNGNSIIPVISVTGNAGQYVYGNISDGNTCQFVSRDVEGYSDGNANVSINDWACAPSVISVGSITTRKYFPTLSKQYLGWSNLKIGDISDFSSYGKTFDGRQLPIVTAPGQTLIAAYNSYYTEKNDYTTGSGEASAYLDQNNRRYFWQRMQGTSMASPFAAGTIALWLQANPVLTTGDIQDIIKKTSVKNEYYNDEPYRWGSGYIDALEGIKLAIQKSGIADVEQDADLSLIVKSIDNRTFDIYLKDAGKMDITLYTITGTMVANMTVIGDNATVSAPGNQPGVMIMRIVTPTQTYTRKIAVR